MSMKVGADGSYVDKWAGKTLGKFTDRADGKINGDTEKKYIRKLLIQCTDLSVEEINKIVTDGSSVSNSIINKIRKNLDNLSRSNDSELRTAAIWFAKELEAQAGTRPAGDDLVKKADKVIDYSRETVHKYAKKKADDPESYQVTKKIAKKVADATSKENTDTTSKIAKQQQKSANKYDISGQKINKSNPKKDKEYGTGDEEIKGDNKIPETGSYKTIEAALKNADYETALKTLLLSPKDLVSNLAKIRSERPAAFLKLVELFMGNKLDKNFYAQLQEPIKIYAEELLNTPVSKELQTQDNSTTTFSAVYDKDQKKINIIAGEKQYSIDIPKNEKEANESILKLIKENNILSPEADYIQYCYAQLLQNITIASRLLQDPVKAFLPLVNTEMTDNIIQLWLTAPEALSFSKGQNGTTTITYKGTKHAYTYAIPDKKSTVISSLGYKMFSIIQNATKVPPSAPEYENAQRSIEAFKSIVLSHAGQGFLTYITSTQAASALIFGDLYPNERSFNTALIKKCLAGAQMDDGARLYLGLPEQAQLALLSELTPGERGLLLIAVKQLNVSPEYKMAVLSVKERTADRNYSTCTIDDRKYTITRSSSDNKVFTVTDKTGRSILLDLTDESTSNSDLQKFCADSAPSDAEAILKEIQKMDKPADDQTDPNVTFESIRNNACNPIYDTFKDTDSFIQLMPIITQYTRTAVTQAPYDSYPDSIKTAACVFDTIFSAGNNWQNRLDMIYTYQKSEPSLFKKLLLLLVTGTHAAPLGEVLGGLNDATRQKVLKDLYLIDPSATGNKKFLDDMKTISTGEKEKVQKEYDTLKKAYDQVQGDASIIINKRTGKAKAESALKFYNKDTTLDKMVMSIAKQLTDLGIIPDTVEKTKDAYLKYIKENTKTIEDALNAVPAAKCSENVKAVIAGIIAIITENDAKIDTFIKFLATKRPVIPNTTALITPELLKRYTDILSKIDETGNRFAPKVYTEQLTGTKTDTFLTPVLIDDIVNSLGTDAFAIAHKERLNKLRGTSTKTYPLGTHTLTKYAQTEGTMTFTYKNSTGSEEKLVLPLKKTKDELIALLAERFKDVDKKLIGSFVDNIVLAKGSNTDTDNDDF